MNRISFEIAEEIKKKIGSFKPETLIILGSGLGGFGTEIEDSITIAYEEIKQFPTSTVKGHNGCLIVGRLSGKDVLCMQGRFHLYEGYPEHIIADIMKAYKILGIRNLIVTNAAGSLNNKMPPASIMLVNDHINFSGKNPLCGPNDDNFGPRFIDLSNTYNAEYRNKVHQIAKRDNIKIFDGVYLMVLGPNFETAAEIRAFKTLGADAVGMSTVPEVLSAVYCGMNILGLSVITNFGTGMQKGSQSHEETLKNGNLASKNLGHIIKEFIKEN